MKRVFSFMALLAIILASNCTRIPENNDPIIGIWTNTNLSSLSETEKVAIRKEWIFNDAYLGRYHLYEGNSLSFKTDFKWEQADGVYTISYPGTDLATATARMKESPEGTILESDKGVVLAKKE